MNTPSRPRGQPKSCRRQNPESKEPPNRKYPDKGNNMQYCTQGCLRGLMMGGILDKLCPNVQQHGKDHLEIDRTSFLRLLRQQLAESLDNDLVQWGIHGSRGVLFAVRLTCYAYTLVAKGTPTDFISCLLNEATIYKRLRPIQGLQIPVHFGNIDLIQPYYYDGIAMIVHMILLSYGGIPISQHMNDENEQHVTHQLKHSVEAIHRIKVLHQDVETRNFLWNAEVGRVIVDFERAKIWESRAALEAISPNRERRQVDMGESLTKRSNDKDDVFSREGR